MKLLRLLIVFAFFSFGCYSEENNEESEVDRLPPDLDSIGDVAIIRGKIDAAEMFYDMALKEDPNNLTAKWGKANVKLAQKDFKGQIQILNEIIEKDSLYSGVYFYRGWANVELERYDAALLDFQHSIKHKFEISESQVSIAHVFSLKNDNKSAKKFYDLAIKTNPSSPKHYLERSYYYLNIQDTINFCRDYNKSKRLGLLDSIAKGEYPSAKEDIVGFNSICNR